MRVLSKLGRKFAGSDLSEIGVIGTPCCCVTDSLALQLPKAPEAAEALAEAAQNRKEAEARAAYEADVAAVRELRMCLRDVATRLLTDRRWRSLALPVTPQEDPEYWQRVRLHRTVQTDWPHRFNSLELLARHGIAACSFVTLCKPHCSGCSCSLRSHRTTCETAYSALQAM